MNRVVRGGLALCLGFASTLIAVRIADQRTDPAPAPGERLGSVDFGKYCQEMYGDASAALLDDTEGAFGWRCWTTTNDLVSSADIDVHDVCAWTYGEPVFDQSSNVNDPFSWECFRGASTD